MKETKVVVSEKVKGRYLADLTILVVAQKRKGVADISAIESAGLKRCVDCGDFRAREKEYYVEYDKDATEIYRGKRVAFVGIGELNGSNEGQDGVETLRITGGVIAQLCKKMKAKKLCLMLSPTLKNNEKHLFAHLVEGVLLGDYRFEKYKKIEKDKAYNGIKEIRYVAQNNPDHIRRELKEVKLIADSVFHARNMANEPGCYWTPENFAKFAEELAQSGKVQCKVFGKKDLQKRNMGGVLAVNKGSAVEPKMVIVEYKASEKAKTILLVGKGITFDSGGVSLKPAAGMEDMKYDMCGGAAVLAVMNW